MLILVNILVVCDCNKVKMDNLSSIFNQFWEKSETLMYGGKPVYQYAQYFLNWNYYFNVWIITNQIDSNSTFAMNWVIICFSFS